MATILEQLGPYKLTKKLGQGGMGAVFAAVDTETGNEVAVKVLAPALAAEEGFRARFEAEIESLKKLRHPNIVRLLGYGEEQGSMFYAMELVRGSSLEDEIRHGRHFDWREVTQIAIKMCKALKHAHDHGIVHRDIKPANIMMTPDGDVKLSDFGIARLFGNTRMTSDGGILGTAEYMAPEQADGRSVTERCDQYSLGGVMFALLAGRPPFQATSFVEMLQLQRFSEPPSVRRFASDTPAELERIIAQLLSKDPAKRFVNTTMLARALEAMEKGLSVSSARNDFVVADPAKTQQPHLTGLDPFAATLVPSEQPDDEQGYSIATPQDGTVDGSQVISLPAAERTIIPPATHFTKVREESHERSTWYGELAEQLFSPQVLGLLAALVVVVGVTIYLLIPASADALYEGVQSAAKTGSIDELRQVEPKLDQFIERYPADSRVEEIRSLKEKILAERRARNARIGGRSPSSIEKQSPIERAYVEATALAATQPEKAIAKLQALVRLYEDADLSEDDGRSFIEIAKNDVLELRLALTQSIEQQRRLLAAQVERAQAISAENPARAQEMWQSMVTLYADKPWAAKSVKQARDALDKLKKD